MFERPIDDIADDFHIAMGMGAKTAASGNAVIVNHAQGTKARVSGTVTAK